MIESHSDAIHDFEMGSYFYIQFQLKSGNMLYGNSQRITNGSYYLFVRPLAIE
jgi:hypothetical protein